MECVSLTTKIGSREAQAILEPYFVALQELFFGHGFELVKRVSLHCSKKLHDTARHFAGCSEDAREIWVAPEMVELDEPIVVGIMAHEFGHAVDFAYPGEFFIGRNERIERRRRDDFSEKQWLRWQRAWRDRDPDAVEKTADLIAGEVWGRPIGYVGPCVLQSFEEGGVPRPVGLR